jgi:hypothetical protein
MHGAIHGIWLTGPGGKLHPNVVPNLSSWVKDAADNGFDVILWTNKDQIAPEEVQRLEAAKILVLDHSKCKNSHLYKHFQYFLDKAINGDNAAFALASDVLRVTILDLIDENSIFIYVDPNDTKLIDLGTSLKHIEERLLDNKLGFSFKVEPNPVLENTFDTRNDVIIALKRINIDFFKEYLWLYWNHLEKTYESYFKPITKEQAQNLANYITNQITHEYLRVDTYKYETEPKYRSYVISKSDNHYELYQKVNTSAYLKSEKIWEYGDTWLAFANKDAYAKQKDHNLSILPHKIILQHDNKQDQFKPVESVHIKDNAITNTPQLAYKKIQDSQPKASIMVDHFSNRYNLTCYTISIMALMLVGIMWRRSKRKVSTFKRVKV